MRLVINGANGIYVGARIAELYGKMLMEQQMYTEEDIAILSDLDHEDYCEVWACAVGDLRETIVEIDGDVFELDPFDEYCEHCDTYHPIGEPIVSPSECEGGEQWKTN